MGDDSDKQKQSILIVDDTLSNLQLLMEMLDDFGYTIRPVQSGKLALKVIETSPPDLILLDINMPEMDGYEVCERLKSHETNREIPIIFLSAMHETKDKIKAFDAGGVDYITKPFEIKEVQARITTHLSISLQKRQLLEQKQQLTEQKLLIEKSYEELKELEIIQKREDELKRHRDHLEDMVVERTAANRALEEQMAERNRLEREIVRASDSERLRISLELHDGLCQQLTGARLRCVALESRLTAAGIDCAEVQPLGQLLDEAVNHAYNLSKGLWPLEHDSKGLAERIRRLSEQSGIAMEFHQKRGCSECFGKQLIQIHNIAREAITNAVKYSRATLITVSLECNATDGIVLEVRDNGVGMDAQIELGTSGGMGIGIMKHRAMIIEGTLKIDNAEGGGTVVVCSAPCPVQQSREDHYA